MKKASLCILLSLCSLHLLSAQDVIHGGDSGEGSLRKLIEETTVSEITIQEGVVITLESPIAINRTLTIKGGDQTVIQVATPGVSAFRIFSVESGSEGLTLENLILKGGSLPRPEEGGAIYISHSNVPLTFTNVTVQDSRAIQGGAIYTEGSVTATGSKFLNNSYEEYEIKKTGMAHINGGAIYAKDNLSLTDCHLEGNHIDISYVNHITPDEEWNLVAFKGGAVYCGNDVVIRNTTFANNFIRIETKWAYFERELYGGALYAAGNVIAENVLFDSNHIDINDNNQVTHNYGGALAVDGDITAEGDLNFKGNKLNVVSRVKSNKTYGGAIYLKGSITATEGVHSFRENKSGNFEDDFLHYFGGAIYIVKSEKTSYISNAQFIGCGAANGGAIWAEESVKLTLDNTLFDNNRAYTLLTNSNTAMGEAGAIYMGSLSELRVTNSKFYRNEAGNVGGAIYSFGKFFMESCEIGNPDDDTSGNTAKNGGGIHVGFARGDAEVVVKNSKFCYNVVNNKGNGYGGGAYISFYNSVQNVSVDISGCLFKENHSINGRGSGLHIAGGSNNTDANPSVNISECTFTGNKSKNEGSALLVDSYSHMTYGIEAIVSDCSFSDNITSSRGTAYISAVKKITFTGKKSIFSGNTVKEEGAGIYFTNVIKAYVEDAIFKGNNGTEAGGIFAYLSDVEIDECKFLENTNLTGWSSAVYNNTGTMKIANSLFKGNKTSGSGGAIFSFGKVTNTFTDIDNCTIQDNKGTYGAAIYNYTSQMTIKHSLIEGNEASAGGGICNASKLVVLNTRVINNKATASGSGFYNYGAGEAKLVNVLIAGNESAGSGFALVNEAGSSTLTNVTVADNTNLNQSGGGIQNKSELKFYNTIVWGNTTESPNVVNQGTGSVEYHHSLVEDITQDDGISGNIDGTLNPRFNTDYTLRSSSPAADKGEYSYFPFDLTTTDLAGNARIFNEAANGIIDLGAYEYFYIPEPEPEPETPILQWSVSTTDDQLVSFNDVENNITTSIYKGDSVFLQIRPVVVPEIRFDSWQIEYTAEPVDYEFYMAQTGADVRYNFNEGKAYVDLGTYIYTVTRLLLYDHGILVNSYYYRTPYVHTIIIEESTNPGPDPDPDPEPEPEPYPDPDPDPDPLPNPDPNPEEIIMLRSIAGFCFYDQEIRIPYDLYTDQSLQYAIYFSNTAIAAGFENITTYKDFPEERYITVPVTAAIPKGRYQGEVRIMVKGSKYYDSYPFVFDVLEVTRITEQPVSASNRCEGDGFVLNVEAIGSNLTYQWFRNDVKIEGATSKTYEGVLSEGTEGVYYVEVYGDCGSDISEKVIVSLGLTVLIKWDDVLYITNTDNRFAGFQWYKDNVAIQQNGKSIYYTDPAGMQGAYHVRAYYTDGTYKESCPLVFTERVQSSTLRIYPTIVAQNDALTIESNELGESYIGAHMDLYNMNGQKVHSGKVRNMKEEIYMHVPAGVYFLHITALNGKRTVEEVIVK